MIFKKSPIYIYTWWGDFLKIIVDTLKHELNKICTILRSWTSFLTTSVNSKGYKLGLPVLTPIFRKRTLGFLWCLVSIPLLVHSQNKQDGGRWGRWCMVSTCLYPRMSWSSTNYERYLHFWKVSRYLWLFQSCLYHCCDDKLEVFKVAD